MTRRSIAASCFEAARQRNRTETSKRSAGELLLHPDLATLTAKTRYSGRPSVAVYFFWPNIYCPPSILGSYYLARTFHAFQGLLGSLGKVVDRLGDLICCHCFPGKRQFIRYKLRYIPACPFVELTSSRSRHFFTF